MKASDWSAVRMAGRCECRRESLVLVSRRVPGVVLAGPVSPCLDAGVDPDASSEEQRGFDEGEQGWRGVEEVKKGERPVGFHFFYVDDGFRCGGGRGASLVPLLFFLFLFQERNERDFLDVFQFHGPLRG